MDDTVYGKVIFSKRHQYYRGGCNMHKEAEYWTLDEHGMQTPMYLYPLTVRTTDRRND